MLLTGLLIGSPAFGQTAKKTDSTKTTPAKSTAAKSTAAKNTAAKTTPHTAGTSAASKTSPTTKNAAGKSNTKGKKQPVAAKAWVQTQPSPSRYKEIQQALADKGYFGGTLDGNWGNDSTEALKRFQKDQNIEPDGKIGSLSLIALGLGPKRGTQAAKSVTAASPTTAPASTPEP
jgi:peptidoglycan hydrolase-like protein with peptidoglycan-binding domain